MATEVLQDRKFTKAADIFALGVSILELAADLDLPKHGKLEKNMHDYVSLTVTY